MTMIGRPQLLVRYARTYFNKEPTDATCEQLHPQCASIGISIFLLSNTGTGCVRLQANLGWGGNVDMLFALEKSLTPLYFNEKTPGVWKMEKDRVRGLVLANGSGLLIRAVEIAKK